MGLIPSLLNSLGHLVTVGLDVLCFFVLLRLATYWFNFEWLSAFNRAGAPLVDWLAVRIEQGLSRLSPRLWSEKAALAIGLVILACIGILLRLAINARIGT